MRLWHGLSRRIVLLAIVCGITGLISSSVMSGVTARDVIVRNTVPMWIHLWTHGEQARCEAAPASWTLSLVEGSHAWAYDPATLVSRNPDAPPVEPELLANMAPGGNEGVLMRPALRGGAAAYRSPRGGPCGLVVVSWSRRVSALDATIAFLVGTVLAGGGATALGMLTVVRPLALRVARLKRAAESVGDVAGYASALKGAPDDDLGELSAGLDRAHERIRDDAKRLEQRQADLQRHLDDVTHDLRTPIASLQLALEHGMDAAGEPALRELLHGALKDVLYLGALTANLRLASQLREGWSPRGAAAPANLVDTVQRVSARARIVARRGGIALDVAVPDDPVLVACDPVAAEQAVGNIVDNAVAYGEPGGHVAVVLERDGDRFFLHVEDDGPGVRTSSLPRLGERTFRTDDARQRDPRGSGLGLAITTEVCQRCGWTLTFEPAEPHGLLVSIRGDVGVV